MSSCVLRLKAVGFALMAVALVACTAPISVHIRNPDPPPALANDAASLNFASKVEKQDPFAAAGIFAEIALRNAAAASRGDAGAVSAYNHAVARFIGTFEDAQITPWHGSFSVPTNSGPLTISGTTDFEVDARQYELIPVDTLEFSGKYAEATAIRDGIGAPIVAIRERDEDFRKTFDEERRHIAATAVLESTGSSSAVIRILDPLQRETARFEGRDVTLAADYGAPSSMLLAVGRIDKLGLVRLLRPERYNDTTRLTRTQIYDPERIPVLFVHGLQDTPATWAPMFSRLLNDPEIRDAYQFWVFSYPSGYPYPYSASLLREELDALDAAFPDHKDMVIVGHSMGGIISRLMLTDTGNAIWEKMLGGPPEEKYFDRKSARVLRDSLIFESRPNINRAIFISCPHRGSILASNWIGRTVSRLVRLPGFITDTRNVILSIATADAAGVNVQRMPNSIDTLSPTSAFVSAINSLPIKPGVPYHTISGDRGRGDSPDSSDGVVSYTSSHLKDAVSEKIVSSDHSAHQNPEGIQEVRRILRLHAGLPSPRRSASELGSR